MIEPTVHVVDDDRAVRDSLSFLLESSGMRACVYESALALLDAAATLAPGCVVTDVRMPQMNGLDLVRRLKARGVDHPVIVITGHGDVPLAVEAMKAGAVDFLEKPFSDNALLNAIQIALAGRPVDDRARADKPRLDALLAPLSPRERDVLSGVVAGKPNKIIAYELGISPRTVEVYRANVMTKSGAGSLSELVRIALLAGF